MAVNNAPVVYFDIGDTLGLVRISSTRNLIERIDVFPHVFEILERLTEMGARLGVISNRGGVPEKAVNKALKECGLFAFFAPDLVIYGEKNSVDIFIKAAEKAGLSGIRGYCLFVGENESERMFAKAAGFLIAEHPAKAPEIISKLLTDETRRMKL